MRPGILTLTTDFGHDGPYVASIKGIVLGLAPHTRLVDVTHAVAPQNILEAAFVLSGLIDVFPPGTVHLAVVDPGVGTDRRLVAVDLEGQWFVLPDNGLISGALQGRSPGQIRELTNPALRRSTVSCTFHGRDILAPAAAHLLRGGDPEELGPIRADLILIPHFQSRSECGGFLGEVIFRDAFGNLITNIRSDRLEPAPPASWTVEIHERRIRGLQQTYADRPPGSLVALVGSSGWVEVAVVNGDAARLLNAGRGTTVRIRPEGRP